MATNDAARPSKNVLSDAELVFQLAQLEAALDAAIRRIGQQPHIVNRTPITDAALK